jgi:hypothetical protein
MPRFLGIVIALPLALAACDGGPPPADAGLDAGEGGVAVDGGSDAGEPSGPRFCQPCRLDAHCGELGACLYFDDGTAGCGRHCASDADCAGLPLPSRCEEAIEGLPPQCVPERGSCVNDLSRVARTSRACRASDECTDPAFPWCSLGLCVAPCASDGECSAPYGRCLLGRCTTALPGAPCASDADCGGTYDRCVGGLTAGERVCTTACESDADCPFLASHCVELEPGRRFCAPDRATSAAICRALVEAGRAIACDADGRCPAGRRCFREGVLAVCMERPTAEGCSEPAEVVRSDADGHPMCVPTLDHRDHVAACECVLGVPGSMLDEGLGRIGRDRCNLAFPLGIHRSVYDRAPILAAIAEDPFRLSFTTQLHGDWLAVPGFAREVASALDAAADDRVRPLARLVTLTAALADLPGVLPVAPTPGGDPGAALEDLVGAAGGTVSRGDLDAQLARLPAGLAARLAPVFRALADAVRAREAAIAPYGDGERDGLWALGPGLVLARTGRAPPVTSLWAQGALRGDVDVAGMAGATARLIAAIEEADLASFRGGTASLTVETPRGRIAIRGSGDDAYEGSGWNAILFLLELGGDDTYRVPVGATTSITHGVSVVVDLGGSDDYGYDERPVAEDVGPEGHLRLPSDGAGRAMPSETNGPHSLSNVGRQGSGRLGIGVLLDLGVEGDRYRSLRMSQGFGALGVGILADAGGDDVYHGEGAVQGSASFGIGVLFDLAGSDRYLAYHLAQGFAYARAVGLLYDAGGDDEYLSHPSDVLYWSPQNPGGSNSSFSQGAGLGRRADFGDGVFMSGGLAILRDREGDDRYTCGIFGQATGYWFGTGLLLDARGADRYDGEWYVQAGAAHYGIAALIDEEGNDRYNESAVRRNVALGGGHDFSVAWLIDLRGNDVYRGPGISFGTGHAGGFGVFVDAAGTDAYDSTSDLSFGHAAIETPGDPLRRATGTYGLFLERGGIDTYARPTLAPLANDATWVQARNPPAENEHGAGIDRSEGSIGVPRIP